MKDLQLTVDFSGLKHCTRSGNLVLHLETRTVWEVSQDVDMKDGLRVAVASGSPEFTDIEATGTLRFDELNRVWFIEFSDDEVMLRTGSRSSATRRHSTQGRSR